MLSISVKSGGPENLLVAWDLEVQSVRREFMWINVNDEKETKELGDYLFIPTAFCAVCGKTTANSGYLSEVMLNGVKVLVIAMRHCEGKCNAKEIVIKFITTFLGLIKKNPELVKIDGEPEITFAQPKDDKHASYRDAGGMITRLNPKCTVCHSEKPSVYRFRILGGAGKQFGSALFFCCEKDECRNSVQTLGLASVTSFREGV